MRYAVIGGGPIGGGMAARLFLAGEDVYLIDSDQTHVDRIRTAGLTAVLDDGTYQKKEHLALKATTDPLEVGMVDIVIIAVKCTVTEAVFSTVDVLAGENTLVLSLQNGLGNADVLMRHFPKEQIGYSVVAYGGSRTVAGEIYTQASVGNLHLAVTAYASSQREKLCEMAQHLKAVQFHMECYTPERLDKVLWTKLTTNCVLNGACAICQCTDDALFSCKEGVDLAKLIVSENCAVARALGIDLTPADIPMVYYEVMPRKVAGYRHFPSMAVDVQNHRKTEIDFINGAVVRAGGKAGVPTPYNRMILLLMRVVEQNYDG